jgi:opacity protein-like surface antigen
MKKIIRIVSVSALLATAAVAQAQVYVEGAYAPLKISDGSDSIKPAALTGVVGYAINPNVAVEGLLGLGVKKGSDETKLSNTVGIFVKPKMMLNNEVEVFGRLGFARTKLKYSDDSSESDSSFAYGLGGNYYLNKQTYLTASYMSLYSKDGSKVNGFNLGAGYKF